MRTPDVITGALVGAAALSHVAWIAVDGRSPRDLGRFYEALPALFSGRDGFALLRPGGWYNGAMAGWLHLVGPSPDAFQSPDVLALVGVLIGVALVARRLAGPWAGLAAVGIAAGAPMIRALSRGSWLHVPEAALLLAILVVLAADPPLVRRASLLGALTLGVLAITLRPSALPWLAPLAALAILRAGRAGAAATVAWALAAIPALVTLAPYLAAKLAARDRYVSDVPALGLQLVIDLGPPSLIAISLGLAALAWALWRHGLPGSGVRAVLWAWTVTGLVLWGVFRAGLDNFTIAATAAAILAAEGIATATPSLRAIGVAAALIAGLGPVIGWLPPTGGLIATLAGLPPPPAAHNLDRPWLGTPDALVPALIAATCAGPCRIAVDDGLFEANAEEPGRLGLFLLGESDVQLVSLAEGPIDGHVDALVRWQTPPEESRRRSARYPRVQQAADALVTREHLSLAWRGADRQGTVRTWWTPGGVLGDAPVDAGDPTAPPPGPPR